VDEFECPDWQISEDGTQECHACDTGLFPNTYSETDFSGPNTACVICAAPPGSFCTNAGTVDSTRNTGMLCVPGKSCAGGQHDPVDCPGGKDCSVAGTVKDSEPDCPENHYWSERRHQVKSIVCLLLL
jgi:hypothetical protein